MFVNPTVADSLSLVDETIRITAKNGQTYNFKYELSTNKLQVIFENEVRPHEMWRGESKGERRGTQRRPRRQGLNAYD